MRIQEQMQKQREARQEQEMLIHQFARDFGFQQRDIKNWLQGRGLVPVRRQTIAQYNSSTYEPSRYEQEEERNIERFMTPQGQRAVNVIRAGVQRQQARRRQTMYQSIATPLQSPRDEVRRSLSDELQSAEEIAQEAADEGVPSSTLLKRAGGMLASGASAAGGMIASGASAAASATGSALAAGAPVAAKAVGQAAGAVIGAVPGAVTGTVSLLSKMTEGVVDGIGVGARAFPIDYGFRRRSRSQDLPRLTEGMSPDAIFQLQQDMLRYDLDSYRYLPQLPPIQPLTEELRIQPEVFERQAAGASSSSSAPAASAPVPPPASASASAAAAAEEEPTEKPRRRLGSRSVVRNISEMSELVDVSLEESPNETIKRRVDERFALVKSKKEQLDAMLDAMLAETFSRVGSSSKPTTVDNTRKTLSGAMRDLEKIFRPKNISPEDTGVQQLIVIYYTLKKLQKSYNLPPSTSLQTLSSQIFI